MTEDALHRKIRQLIGDRFDYLGEVWVLIEVLGDADSVVLRRQESNGRKPVQQNAYGVPTRRAEETLTLRISDSEGGYSDDLLVLLEGRRPDSGRA